MKLAHAHSIAYKSMLPSTIKIVWYKRSDSNTSLLPLQFVGVGPEGALWGIGTFGQIRFTW